jgi:hypothetical protein
MADGADAGLTVQAFVAELPAAIALTMPALYKN